MKTIKEPDVSGKRVAECKTCHGKWEEDVRTLKLRSDAMAPILGGKITTDCPNCEERVEWVKES